MNPQSSQRLKEQHELAVASAMLNILGVNACFLRHGDAKKNEPDILYQWQTKILGIEVTTAYYDNRHAEGDWKIARGKIKLAPKTPATIWTGWDENFDDKICRATQEQILTKSRKNYAGIDLLWLCIERESPASENQAALDCARQLTIPTETPFQRTFICYQVAMHEGGDFRAIELPTLSSR